MKCFYTLHNPTFIIILVKKFNNGRLIDLFGFYILYKNLILHARYVPTKDEKCSKSFQNVQLKKAYTYIV